MNASPDTVERMGDTDPPDACIRLRRWRRVGTNEFETFVRAVATTSSLTMVTASGRQLAFATLGTQGTKERREVTAQVIGSYLMYGGPPLFDQIEDSLRRHDEITFQVPVDPPPWYIRLRYAILGV